MTCDHAARTIDRHFAGDGDATSERTMRAHLDGCDACRAYYDRHLLLARLDPRALGERERIARSLGLPGRPSRPRQVGLSLGLATLVAACLMLWLRPSAAPFSARGGTLDDTSALYVYRLRPGEKAVTAHLIRRTDELAFAYRNPRRYTHLMVFAADEHGHIYWYHPGWTVAAEDPQAIDIAPDETMHELPEAVAQPLDAPVLHVYGVFCNDAPGVKEIEAAWSAGGGSLAWPGAQIVRVDFDVEPR